MKYGFVYIWRDSKRNMYYIGCHWGTEDDGYICSSRRMRDAYRNRPETFKRRIIKTNIQCKKLMLEEEYRYLSMIKDEELGKKYYNLHTRIYKHWFIDNVKTNIIKKQISNAHKNRIISQETRQKIRISRLGKKMSEETKRKISESKKGQIPTEFNKIQRLKAITGKHLSEETKQKIRIKHLGKTISEEHKLKISHANKGKKHLNRKRIAPVTDIERFNRAEGQRNRKFNDQR